MTTGSPSSNMDNTNTKNNNSTNNATSASALTHSSNHHQQQQQQLQIQDSRPFPPISASITLDQGLLGTLYLKDGEAFHGHSFGYEGPGCSVAGELVFQTGELRVSMKHA